MEKKRRVQRRKKQPPVQENSFFVRGACCVVLAAALFLGSATKAPWMAQVEEKLSTQVTFSAVQELFFEAKETAQAAWKEKMPTFFQKSEGNEN